MCLIVDANCCSLTVSADPHPDFLPIMNAIKANKASLVLGGTKLKAEYQFDRSVWRLIRVLESMGKVKLVSDTKVDEREAELEASGVLKSDDPHVIALAQVSGARLLCSRDQNLHQDFSNAKLVSRPRGSIYQNAGHAHLIQKCC